MIPGQSMALGAAAVSPNGKAPRCEHLDGLALVAPQSDDCRDCRSRQDRKAEPCGLPDLRLGGLFG